MLKDAIKLGKKQTLEALQKRYERRLLQPLSARGFEHVFKSHSVMFGYGDSPLLSKKDWGMLKNFINSLKRDGWEDETIRDLASLLVEGWSSSLAGREVLTNRQSLPVTLPMRPSLQNFLSCTKDILSILYEE